MPREGHFGVAIAADATLGIPAYAAGLQQVALVDQDWARWANRGLYEFVQDTPKQDEQ